MKERPMGEYCHAACGLPLQTERSATMWECDGKCEGMKMPMSRLKASQSKTPVHRAKPRACVCGNSGE